MRPKGVLEGIKLSHRGLAQQVFVVLTRRRRHPDGTIGVAPRSASGRTVRLARPTCWPQVPKAQGATHCASSRLRPCRSAVRRSSYGTQTGSPDRTYALKYLVAKSPRHHWGLGRQSLTLEHGEFYGKLLRDCHPFNARGTPVRISISPRTRRRQIEVFAIRSVCPSLPRFLRNDCHFP